MRWRSGSLRRHISNRIGRKKRRRIVAAMSEKDKTPKEEPVRLPQFANEADFVGEHSDKVITKVSNFHLIYSLAAC
jgi:hypothetical protein